MSINVSRCGGSAASHGLISGAGGRQGAPGWCAQRPGGHRGWGAVLVNVPEHFLPPQIKATFARLLQTRTIQTESRSSHLNFGVSFYPITQPLRIPVSSKQNSKLLCSKFLALQRLEEVAAAIKQASRRSKQHQSRQCGVSRTEK